MCLLRDLTRCSVGVLVREMSVERYVGARAKRLEAPVAGDGRRRLGAACAWRFQGLVVRPAKTEIRPLAHTV